MIRTLYIDLGFQTYQIQYTLMDAFVFVGTALLAMLALAVIFYFKGNPAKKKSKPVATATTSSKKTVTLDDVKNWIVWTFWRVIKGFFWSLVPFVPSYLVGIGLTRLAIPVFKNKEKGWIDLVTGLVALVIRHHAEIAMWLGNIF